MVTSSLAPFLSAARNVGVPIVWVRTAHDGTTNSIVWMAREGMFLEATLDEQRPANCVTGTWGAEFFHIAPEPGEPVVTKSRHSAFVGTNLDVILKTIGRPSLLFTGVSTNTCVESTLRDALYRDYHVTLVENCCVGSDRACHAATIENVQKRFGPVVMSDAVTEAWGPAGEQTLLASGSK